MTLEDGPFEKSSVGLYRDDGLGVAKGTDRTRDKNYRKRIEEIFKDEGLKITTEINMIETDFLDVKLNLETITIGQRIGVMMVQTVHLTHMVRILLFLQELIKLRLILVQ